MNYFYTPNDIAVFLLKANFPLKFEQAILTNLWEEQNHIANKFKHDKFAFMRAVQLEIASYIFKNEIDELDLILRDVEPNYVLLNPCYEHDIILRFFKIIQLELFYIPNKDYYKIKLRRLLKRFGYKRRSSSLIQHITQTLTVLSLTPYLRGYASCDIATIDIDTMVMIRLK